MSKKMLNYAGRRGNLLALIVMATLTLGVLFSGWLTPTPGRAQNGGGGGGGSNNENTNCPNYVTNVIAVVCPKITNQAPYYGPYTFCAKHGSFAILSPEITNPPAATDGYVITSITETCSNITTYVTNSVTWTFSGLNYYISGSPPDGDSPPGTYTRDCYIVVTSSDTNNCPGPGTIDHNTITWNIISPYPITTTKTMDISKISDVFKGIVTAASVVGGSCKVYGLDTVVTSQSIETSDTCCGDGTIGNDVKTTVSCGLPVMGETCKSPKLPVLGGAILLNLSETVEISGSISGSAESKCGVLDELCLTPGVTLKASGCVEASVAGVSSDYISFSACISGSGTISGSYCQKQTSPGVFEYDPAASNLVGCMKTVDISGTITLFGGLTKDVSCNLYTGQC